MPLCGEFSFRVIFFKWLHCCPQGHAQISKPHAKLNANGCAHGWRILCFDFIKFLTTMCSRVCKSCVTESYRSWTGSPTSKQKCLGIWERFRDYNSKDDDKCTLCATHDMFSRKTNSEFSKKIADLCTWLTLSRDQNMSIFSNACF